MSSTLTPAETPTFRPRWRDDATGRVAPFAGEWASDQAWTSRADLEEIVRQMPNGDQVEIVEAVA
jgi:hypothetical protein